MRRCSRRCSRRGAGSGDAVIMIAACESVDTVTNDAAKNGGPWAAHIDRKRLSPLRCTHIRSTNAEERDASPALKHRTAAPRLTRRCVPRRANQQPREEIVGEKREREARGREACTSHNRRVERIAHAVRSLQRQHCGDERAHHAETATRIAPRTRTARKLCDRHNVCDFKAMEELQERGSHVARHF